MAQQMKGWFSTPGRPGDRTLDDQRKGLEPLYAQLFGATVLDVGCAEGLLAMDFVTHHAAQVHGVEIVAEHVKVAQRLNPHGNRCTFQAADANTFQPVMQYDIVTMLAILHKLRNPTEACARFAGVATKMCVIRLPPEHAPTIIDPRSGNNPHHIGKVMAAHGWRLDEAVKGPFDEWCGYYVRTNP